MWKKRRKRRRTIRTRTRRKGGGEEMEKEKEAILREEIGAKRVSRGGVKWGGPEGRGSRGEAEKVGGVVLALF